MSCQVDSRINILGVGVNPLNIQKSVELVDAFLKTGQKGYICVTGMHGIMEAQDDPDFRTLQNNSLLTTPDGMPTVWIGRWTGHRDMRQVCGADFMLKICEATSHTRYRHFLYGGKAGVAETLRDKLIERFPGLAIVGTYTPPFRQLNSEEEGDLRNRLLETQADILWCGISTPKQERFMAQYIDFLPVKLMVGVGAAFDINAGLLKDSPQWIKRCGLQWAHRLCMEPRRLWRRYLLNIPRFVWLCFLQGIGLRAFELPKIAATSLMPTEDITTTRTPNVAA